MWLPLILLLSISHLGCSFNQKRFDKLRIVSQFHPKVAFSNEFHSKSGSDLLSRTAVQHDDPLSDDFTPHFAETNYDFMIPEGEQKEVSIAAILSFISDPSIDPPSFAIKDEFDWFAIGSQKSQVNVNGVLETEVAIDTKKGVHIDSRRIDDDAYALQVTALSGNRSVSVPVRVDILPAFGMIKIMPNSINSTKREDETDAAADSREEIEGRERKTSPKFNPTTTVSTTTTPSTTTTVTTPSPTTSSTLPTTVFTTPSSTTIPTTVSTTTSTTTVPTTTTTESTTTTTTVPSTTVATTESTTTSTTTDQSTTQFTMETPTTTDEPTTVPTTTQSTTVSTTVPTTVSTTASTTTEPSTTVAVPKSIRLNVEGLSEEKSVVVKNGLSKGELVNNFSIMVDRDGRPDGSLFNITVDRSDLFDIQPKRVEQGGKAFLFVRDPNLIREKKGLMITITVASDTASSSIDLPVTLLADSSSEIIRFSIPESAKNGERVGDLPDRSIERILALEGLPFTLVNSSLFLSCEAESCLDRETIDHYEFFVKFADNPSPLSVVIEISDVNDNPPSLSLSDEIIRVSSNRLLSPLAVTILDADTSPDQKNAILLTGDAARFFTLKSIEGPLYELLLTSSPSNSNYSLTVSVVDTTRPDFPSHSKEITIVAQRGKARFRKEMYERTLIAEKIATGDSLLGLELEGVPVDEVDIVCLGGNPGWITVEAYGGKMSVAALPRKGVEGGEFTVLVGAIDRETSEVVADTRVKITVEGGVKKEKKMIPPFHKNIYTFKTIREHSESIDSLFSVDLDTRDSSVSPSIVFSSIVALDSNGVSTQFPIDSLKLNESIISIEKSAFANLRLLRMEVEAEQEMATVLIFFSSSSIAMEKLRRERSRPIFAIPEGTEDDVIEISMLEESPSGRVVVVLPAVDASKGENVETRLEGEMAEFFHVQQSTGAVVVARSLDLESLPSPSFNLSLIAGESPFDSHLDLHFTIENVDDNPPIVHPDSRVVNISIWENAALSSRVASLSVSDIDSPSLRFVLIGEKADHFTVKSTDEGGVITLEKEIDREEDGDLLILTLLVIDGAGHTAEATANIRVMDVNDNAPEFTSIHSTPLKAVENWQKGTLLTVMKAIDKDQGENGKVLYRLTQTSPFVSIDKSTGELRLAQDLVGMANEEIPLTVMAHDSGSPQLSSLLNLTVSVIESTGKESLLPHVENLPEQFVALVSENSTARSRVFTVSAVSPSGGKGGLIFDLLPSTPSEAGWIDIDKNSGVIYLLRSIDPHHKRDISGVLTIRSSSSSLNRFLFRVHVNSSTQSIAPPIKENSHLVYPIGKSNDWPKIGGVLPISGGSVERIFDENCSNSSAISIDAMGQINLVDDPNQIEDGTEVCLLAKRGSNQAGKAIRFTLEREEKTKKSRFIPPHSHAIVLGKEGVEDNTAFTQDNSHVQYKIKSVNFTEMSASPSSESEKDVSSDVSSLFVIDPLTSEVIVDPLVRMKKNGYYNMTIEAMKENKTVGVFNREIHSISSSSQVKLVFDMTPHELGRNVESFESKLNEILKGRGKVYMTEPKMDNHSNKSSLCVHVLLNSSLMPQSTALSLLSLPLSDSPLTNLYHAYKVSDLGTCDSSLSVSSLFSSSFSSSFLISSSIVSLLSFLLISSILYVCCLLRERDRLNAMERTINKESESSRQPTPSQFYTLSGSQSIPPYGLY